MKKLKITQISNHGDFSTFVFLKNGDIYAILNDFISKFNFHEAYFIEDKKFNNPIDSYMHYCNESKDVEFHILYGLNKMILVLVKTTPEFKTYLMDHSEFLKP